MDGTVFPCGQLTESLQIPEVVRFAKEAWPAIVAPLDHMLGDIGDIQARLACDGEAPVRGVAQYREVAASPFSPLQQPESENCTLTRISSKDVATALARRVA